MANVTPSGMLVANPATEPDLSQESVAMQRRQQLADMLRQQSLEPLGGTEMVSGRAVRQSPLLGLNKIAQALAGNYLQSQNDQSATALNNKISAAQNARIDSMLGTGQSGSPTTSTPIVGSYRAPDGTPVGDTGSQSVPMTAAPQAQQINPDMVRVAAMLKSKDPTLVAIGSKLAENLLSVPPEVRAIDLLGRNRQAVGAGQDAVLRAQGVIKLSPNDTAIIPGQSSPVVAADFSKGTTGGYDANGNPTMGGVAGNQVLAQLLGAQTKATEEAKQGVTGAEIVTLKLSDGTEIQVPKPYAEAYLNKTKTPPQLAGGVPTMNAPTDAAALSAAQGMMGKGPFAVKVNDPNMPITPGLQQPQVGRTQSQADLIDQQQQMERAKTLGSGLGTQAADKPTATLALNDAFSNMDRLGQVANKIISSQGINGITGIRGAIPDIPGSAAADARAQLATLKSQAAFSVLQAMRNASKTGGALGQISDKEEAMLANNLAALETSQSSDALKTALKGIADWTVGAKSRLQTAYDMTYSGGNPTVQTGQSKVMDFSQLPKARR